MSLPHIQTTGLLFLLLSLLSPFVGKVVLKRLFLKLFLKDKKLSKLEKLTIQLSVIASYIFSLAFLQLSLLAFFKTAAKHINLLFFVVYVTIGTYFVLKLIDIASAFLVDSMKKKVSSKEEPLVDTYSLLITRLVKAFTVTVAMLAVLKEFGFDVTAIVASLGIGSLAVGLAAQDTIKNFISGVILVMDKQFRIGDRVYLKDIDVEGYIYDIGLRTTKVLTIAGNNLITVPNSKLTEGIIENALFPDEKFKDSIDVGVAYGSDIDKVKELLLRAAQEETYVLKNPKPMVFFTSFGDSSLNFKLIYYTPKKDMAYGIKSRLHEKINELFEQNGIEIPFPCRTNYFPEALRVKIEKDAESIQREGQSQQK